MKHTERDSRAAQTIREREEEGLSVIQCVKPPVEPAPTESIAAERGPEQALQEETAESAGERAAAPAMEKAAGSKGLAVRLDGFLRRRKISRGMAVGTVLTAAALLTAAAFLLYANRTPDGVPSSSAPFTGHTPYTSRQSDGPQVQSEGEIPSGIASGVPSSRQTFAHGSKREQSGVYTIEQAAVKQWTVSDEAWFSPLQSLRYSSDTAVSIQLYFEPDGQGGYVRHDAGEYRQGLDAAGSAHDYRLDGDRRFDPIVVAYHSMGDRYVFDYAASSRCSALSASADGRKMALFDQSDHVFRLLLFEPETYTLSPFPDAISADIGLLHFGNAEENMSADGRYFAYMRNPQLAKKEALGEAPEDASIDMHCELLVWDTLNGNIRLLKKDVNEATLYWRGNTLYWEENTDGGWEYFRAALPDGSVRSMGKAQAKFPAEPAVGGFLDIMRQHVVLRTVDEYTEARHMHIWNLESNEVFTYAFDRLADIRLSLQSIPILSDDGSYAVCPFLGEEDGKAPALYLAVIRTNGSSFHLYRLPTSVPVAANPCKMLGDQVFLLYQQLTYQDLFSSTLVPGQATYFRLSLAPLPAAGS